MNSPYLKFDTSLLTDCDNKGNSCNGWTADCDNPTSQYYQDCRADCNGCGEMIFAGSLESQLIGVF